MRLTRVALTNIRGFQTLELRLPLDAHWIVLAGRNGTGKTTLLQAIATGILGSTNLSWLIEDSSSWIRIGADMGIIQLELIGSEEDLRQPGDIEGPFSIGLELSHAGGLRDCPPSGNHSFVISQLWGGAGLGAQPHGWCLAGYGASRVSEAATATAERMMKAPPRRSAVVTLFRRDATLQTANAWVGEVVAARFLLQDTAGGSETFRHNCYWMLQALLNDGLVSIAEDSPITLNPWGIGIKRPEGTVPLATAGQGLESIALLVTDLLRQLSRFYGERFMDGIRRAPPANGPVVIPHHGLVLIDEAENHLHPQLQQHLGFWLKEHFPNIQFLLTTHSPFICQAADPGGLFWVGDGRVEPVEPETFRNVVHGSSEEAVLSELFGLQSAWSPLTEKKRAELSLLERSVLREGKATPSQAERMRALAKELPGDLTAQVERVLRIIRVFP
jgi:energy-coupling factor transporter ATP-binding protein EcfA2